MWYYCRFLAVLKIPPQYPLKWSHWSQISIRHLERGHVWTGQHSVVMKTSYKCNAFPCLVGLLFFTPDANRTLVHMIRAQDHLPRGLGHHRPSDRPPWSQPHVCTAGFDSTRSFILSVLLFLLTPLRYYSWPLRNLYFLSFLWLTAKVLPSPNLLIMPIILYPCHRWWWFPDCLSLISMLQPGIRGS